MNKLEIPVLGLTGLAGHGKSEVSKLLAAKTGFAVVALADPVKRAAAGIYNLPIETFYEGGTKNPDFNRNTTKIEPYGLTVREMMQRTGDAMKTQCGGDFWINICKCEILRAIEAHDIKGVIVEDVRYDQENPWGPAGSEYDAVKEWGGRVFHVDAMTRVGRKDVHNTHSSEKGVNRLAGDTIIDNNGGLKQLNEVLDYLVNRICGIEELGAEFVDNTQPEK